MADEAVRYARAADGTSIAYWTIGSGPPVLRSALYESVIEADQRLPRYRSFLEYLGSEMQIVRFDPRGHGLSGRAPGHYSSADLALDISAVAEAVSDAPVFLWTRTFGSGAAFEWAHRYPEQCRGLILWMPIARGRDRRDTAQNRALHEAGQLDPEVGGRALMSFGSGSQADGLDEAMEHHRSARAQLDPDVIEATQASTSHRCSRPSTSRPWCSRAPTRRVDLFRPRGRLLLPCLTPVT